NKQLQEEIQERKRVEQALIEKTHQLEQLNKFLETRVKEEVEKRRSHEGVLLHRSKLEALGEMVGAIAHQWRQPLSTVGFIIENILDDLELGELEGEALEISLNKAVNQIQFMSKVIEGFINFYKPSRIKESFDVVSTVAETISILSPEMERRTIQIQSSCDVESLVIKGYSNDFKQIVFNIINNGKDVIMEREQRGLMSKEEGKIAVTVTCDDKNAIVKISDNGGGVPEEIKNKIFVPFFSTKTEKKGLGIGLYLVKTIIADHMKGSIEVDNTDIGAQFTIKLPRFKKD
ncbi:MAG: HAMP domain-containing histidine kinase, partial [bacterium]|nr:HAMP domain-containing histidine kinase [bacterium]